MNINLRTIKLLITSYNYILLSLLLTSIINIFSENNIYGIILAGGSGKRLWPLSRIKKPKQFITLHDDKTLLENTIDRIRPLVTENNLWIVTTKNYIDAVETNGGKIADVILAEPASRNTAPALLMTILDIYKKTPDAVLFFVPADHYIPDNILFRSYLNQAIKYASNNDNIVLLGIQPHRAATEYGYIEYAEQLEEQIFRVNSFHEKPNHKIATEYLGMDTMLWNTGIFCAKASVFIEEFKKYSPELFKQMQDFSVGKGNYQDIKDEAFDTAVLEKSDKCTVVPSCFKWSDVGNLEQFLIAKQEKEDSSKIVSHKSTNNIVDIYDDKMVVLIDVHDLCLVETSDILLISRRTETDSVKNIIERLPGQYI